MPNFHLDKRADLIAGAGSGDGDDLLTTKDMARWLRVSTQWLHRARAAGYGPPYERIGPHCIRYRRSKVPLLARCAIAPVDSRVRAHG
jgi:hypothetical protein